MRVLKKYMLTAAVCMMGMVGISASHGIEVKKDFTGFDQISIKNTAFTLEIIETDEFEITISGDEDRIEKLLIKKKGHELVFYSADKNIDIDDDDGNLKVVIKMPKFTGLNVKGAVDAHARNLKNSDIDLNVKGAINIELEGSCKSLNISLKGAGNIEAENLKCDDVKVKLKGAGNIEVFAKKSIDADVSGIGNIDVYGNPKETHIDSGFFSNIEIH